MDMIGATMGGDFYCNVCGRNHTPDTSHRNITPLKKAQLACEKLEKFIATLEMSPAARKSSRQLLLELRETLEIPAESFFEDDVYEPIFLLPFIDQKKIGKELEKKRKTRKYEVSDIQREKGRKILDVLQKSIEESARMNDQVFDAFIKMFKAEKLSLKLS